MANRIKLVLAGGGHAMLPTLTAASAWQDEGIDVTLVNDHRYLYYSGMIPEYLGGVYNEEEVRIDLATLCLRKNITFVEAAATHIDCTNRIIQTDDGQFLSYDLAAFDVGACNPGDAGHAIQTKPLHAMASLAHQLDQLEAGARAPMQLVVAGGGAAGVEVALNLSGRFSGPLRKALHLTIVEASTRLLPTFPEGMSRRAADLLTRRGVALHLNDQILEVAPAHVALEHGGTHPADVTLWATGTIGPPLFRKAGLPCDRRGFLRVNPALQCLADPCLFAAGDCATLQGYEDLQKVGVHAVKQGPTLRDNLHQAALALHRGAVPEPDDLEDFRPYPAAPLILSTGSRSAIWVSGSTWTQGRLMLRLKHVLDRRWIRQYSRETWGGTPLWRMPDAAAAAD